MAEDHMKFDKVLVPVDGSVSSEVAVDLALHSASTFNACLEFVFVIDASSFERFGTVDSTQERFVSRMEGELFLERVAKLAEKSGAKHKETLCEGIPWEIVCEKSENADMMILAVSGKSGIRPGRIGSTAKKIIENSHCPVLTLRSGSKRIQEILLPVYDENRPAIDVAIQTARIVGGKITVFSVKEKNTDPAVLVEKVAAIVRDAGIGTETLIAEGDVVDCILGKSGQFDLIVMGVDRRGGLQSILHGGVTERIVSQASCPVTVVRNK